jgi:NAD(P)-dependent dehydrogenase (short-subunit alcohol dehydrogenase family)
VKELRGKTAVVTGAGSGIGKALAFALAAEGMNLGLFDIDGVAAADVGVEAGRRNKVKTVSGPLDVAGQDGWPGAEFMVRSVLGVPHLLCNNAGVVLFSPLLEMTPADWDWIINVNLRGVINGVQAFLPSMLERGGEGHVVNTASLAGLLPSGAMPLGAYTTTKFAVVGYSDSLRLEVEPRGIGVSVLMPGAVETRILDTARYAESAQGLRPPAEGAPTPGRESSRRMAPVEVAALVVEAVKENRPYVVTHPEALPAFEARYQSLRAAFA